MAMSATYKSGGYCLSGRPKLSLLNDSKGLPSIHLNGYTTACAMFVKTLRTDRKLELRKRGYIYHLIHILFLVDFAGVLNTVGYRVKNCTGMELFYVCIFLLAVHSYACCVYRFFERYHYDTHTEDYLRGSQLQR